MTNKIEVLFPGWVVRKVERNAATLILLFEGGRLVAGDGRVVHIQLMNESIQTLFIVGYTEIR